ncbi:glycosyltransferase family 2 protein [Aeromonas dhakensis]|uniref:glycosyltransferase family 2 protein n=1 Tax=Aeromonas dhakensis TaxID=196024 RepID=UPI003EDFECA9
MQDEILLSYVIPSYNHSKYIESVLDSIKKDGDKVLSNYEIVIVDDGSSDNSAEVIQRWIDNNRAVTCQFHRQENKGIAATLNKLYSLSEGEFVRPCSSDDLIIDGSSSVLLDEIRDSVACIFGDGILIDDNNDFISKSSIDYHRGLKRDLMYDKKINKSLIERWCVAGPSLLLRKSFIKNFKYDEAARIDDIDLFLTLLRTSSVQYVDIPVCKYRIHASNTSKTKNTSDRIKNLQSFGRLLNKHLHAFSDGVLRNVLLGQELKNRAKISFLQRKYFYTCVFFILYLLKKYSRGF